MSHIIVRNAPFATGFRAAQNGARELLQRDRARAAKLLAGISPHGPQAFLESFQHRMHRGKTGASTSPAHENTQRSVDVTDAGMSAIHWADNGDARFTCVSQV